MVMKRALITGVSGQDGSYLAELLLEKGYTVYGLVRRNSQNNLGNLRHIKGEVKILYGDLVDQTSLDNAIITAQPDEVYNLAAQSHVHESWNQPFLTLNATGIGAVRLLESIRRHKPDARYYQASSSEQFGNVRESPQRETTPFYPRSPYGVAKATAHWSTVNYRESYGLFACCGIFFNHESPRRSLDFATRKITDGVARIKLGLANKLHLGNLDASRDWGWAPEFVVAMWLMLQQPGPQDFVIATGHTNTVRDFVQTAFSYVGLNWKDYVVVDDRFKRPAEVDTLCGDPSMARSCLGWEATIKFNEIVHRMVDADLERHRILMS